MSNQVHTGLFGFGVVGQGFAQLAPSGKSAVPPIKSIVALHPGKQRPEHQFKLSFDKETILSDPSIEIVVEAISNTEEARQIVVAALRAGKKVITANKKLIAEHFSELQALVKNFNGTLLYEAAVAASIPIIRTLEDHSAEEKILSIRGIVNGTSNFILTKIQQEQKSYAAALAEAQKLGFAEADPFLDVSGRDAVNKLVILAAHAFGTILHPDEIFQAGITAIGPSEVRVANALGATIRLIAKIKLNKNGQLSAFVLPAFVPFADPLSGINGEENAIEVVSESAGKQFYTGKGAGSLPTGLAVRSDVIAAAGGYKYKTNRSSRQEVPAFSQEQPIWIYTPHITELEGCGIIPLEKSHLADKDIFLLRVRLTDCLAASEKIQKLGISIISAEEFTDRPVLTNNLSV